MHGNYGRRSMSMPAYSQSASPGGVGVGGHGFGFSGLGDAASQNQAAADGSGGGSGFWSQAGQMLLGAGQQAVDQWAANQGGDQFSTVPVSQAAPVATQRAPRPAKKGMPTWGWVLLGVGVVAGVGAIAYGVRL